METRGRVSDQSPPFSGRPLIECLGSCVFFLDGRCGRGLRSHPTSSSSKFYLHVSVPLFHVNVLVLPPPCVSLFPGWSLRAWSSQPSNRVRIHVYQLCIRPSRTRGINHLTIELPTRKKRKRTQQTTARNHIRNMPRTRTHTPVRFKATAYHRT